MREPPQNASRAEIEEVHSHSEYRSRQYGRGASTLALREAAIDPGPGQPARSTMGITNQAGFLPELVML